MVQLTALTITKSNSNTVEATLQVILIHINHLNHFHLSNISKLNKMY